MTLQVQEALQHIRHTLGGELSSDLSPVTILNEAGEWLVTAHQWRWLERPSVTLNTRATLSISGATWNSTTLTLTKTSEFANYTFVDGDRLKITGGTSVNQGWYNIASKTNSNDIVLESTIGSGATSDIAFTVYPSSLILPADFKELVDIQPTQGLVNAVNTTTTAYINQLRTNEVAIGNMVYWVAVTWGANATTAGGRPTPRLEVYPTPTTNATDEFTLFYRAGWPSVSADDVFIEIPDYLNMIYVQIVRAIARGYEEEDQPPGRYGRSTPGTVLERLQAIRQSSSFIDAMRRDSQMQASRGAMQGGAVSMQRKNSTLFLKTQVQGPA